MSSREFGSGGAAPANETSHLRPASVSSWALELLNHLTECLFVFEVRSSRIVFANRAALSHVSLGIDSVRGRRIDQVVSINGALEGSLRDHDWKTLAASGQAFFGQIEGSDCTGGASRLRICPLDGDDQLSVLIAEDPDDAANDPDHAHDAKWQLQIAIEALPDGFVLYDAEDRLVICNERYRELYPESAAAMVPGATFEEILKYGLANGQYAAGLGREDEWLQERLTAHRSADRCIEQELGNGRWLRILEQKVPGGGRVGLRIDITEQIHSRERAEIAERRLLDAIDALPAGFWLFDSDDRLVLINERYKELFKLSADALRPGNTYEDVLRYGLKNRQYPAAEGREEEWLATVLDTHRTGGYELEYELADGTWIRSYNQFTSDGGQVGFRVDITELKMQQEELRLAALTDDLTGLRNRRALSTRLEDIANELADGERLAFLHIDLDKFKSINDTLGHDAGDHVLRQTAQKLISGGESFEVAARVGGDEFLLAKKTCDDDQAVIRLGAALVRTICKPVPYRGKLCHVGASVGIAFVTPDRTASIEEIIGDADIALNAAKSAGRSTCRIFTQDMRAVAVQSAVVSAQIQEGLTRHEFQPFLQPQVDIQTLRIIGFEALARWHHPARGVLSATKFIQVAQDSRLIEEIDNQIFAEVCQTISRLHELGMPDPRVSVNVSTAQLSDPMLVDRLIWTADAAEINPACIGIEILESTMLDDRSAHVIENIHRLADEGFPIELDDFGTGHAAIANLRRFPVERIKIDRSFVSGIDQDAELQLITGAIVGLARKLGLRVLAEGIETQAELDFLEEVRCTCAQGFLFARPMAFDDLLSWIETWPHGFGAAPPGTAVA